MHLKKLFRHLKNLPNSQKNIFPHPKYAVPLILAVVISCFYYKFFLKGKIPFPGDLLVTAYAPWLGYNRYPSQNPLISDIFSQFYLWKNLAVESFMQLQWPLWNPYSFSGTPLLATYHSASLYPLNILLFIPDGIGWGLFIFSQSLLAGLFMYVLLGTWLKSYTARVAGSLLFAFGGLMTTWLEFGTAVHGMAWLPLALYSIEKFYQSRKIRFLLVLILSLSCLTLAGTAQITIYGWAIAAGYVVFKMFQSKRLQLSITVPILGAFTLSGTLSALQLLPTLDLFTKSIRLGDTYSNEFNYGLLPFKDFLKFFAPNFFGNPVNRNYWGFLNYSETGAFIGTTTLTFIIYAGIYLRKKAIPLFFFGLLLIALLLTFDNPISYFIYQQNIPLLTLSYASRMLFVVTFCIAVLVGFSIDKLIADQDKNSVNRSITLSLTFVVGTTIGMIIGFYLIYIFTLDASFLNSAFAAQLEEEFMGYYLIALRNLIIPFMLLTGFALTWVLLNRIPIPLISKHRYTLISLIFVVLLTADLGRYFIKFNPFSDRNTIYPTTPTLSFLTEQPGLFRIGREHAEVLPPNTWTGYKLSSYEGYDPLYLNNYSRFMLFLNTKQFQNSGIGRYAELASNYNSTFMDALNVKFFIAVTRTDDGQIGGDKYPHYFKEGNFEPVATDKTSIVLKNTDALERAYFVKNLQVAPMDEAERILSDENFEATNSAVVELPGVVAETPTGSGSIDFVKYTPNEVILNTKTDQEETLVLADQFDEGWRATIDGTPTSVSRANIVLRAIKVPAGEHTISFTYWPTAFDWGLKISFASFIAILSLLIWSLKKKVF